MPAPVARFELIRFECIATGSGKALLRVAGLWHAASELELFAPHLVISRSGDGSERFRAIDGPGVVAPLAGPHPTLWRCAYAVESNVVESRLSAFSLDAGAAGRVDLPRPTMLEPEQAARDATAGRDGAA